jgi:N-6 DNA Methylase
MPATASSQVLTSVRTVGGLLPADMLIRIAEGKDVSGSRPADDHVVGVRSVQAAAERHWDFLKGAWRALRDAIGDAGHDPSGLAVESWLLPLFEEHGFGRLERIPAGIQSTDRAATFPVTHRWRHVPIHLVSWDTDLDHRVPGGGLPPQSMLQECLNRSDEHLWGLLSNGRQLRLLRDSSSLAGAAFIEIDLEAMFDGELTGEYVTLYRLLHASRFETAPDAPPSSARIEKWRAEAIDEGARILDQQRDGVEAALVALGTGFRRRPANAAFREDADPELVKRALLRVVYRLLFWFVAEERDALHDPECDQKAHARYDRYFSARHLRDLALRRHGGTHGDLWQAVTYVLDGLGNERGRPELGLPGLGGIYDDTDTDLILHAPREADGTGSKGPHLQIANEYLLAAVRSLSRFHDKGTGRYRRVDFLHLGSEELGSIYESLLELVPRWGDDWQLLFRDPALARGDDTEDDASDTGDEDGAPHKRGKRNAGGNERKKTGSYYTPASLIDCLLDSALDPVLDAAVKRGEQAASRAASKAGTHATIDPAETVAAELLKVTVCDPACGSGHFLVAAGRRIAKRLAAVREHNPEPTETAYRHALRDVVRTCLYGVDLNPMAVELAKVSLWMEGQEPGRALSFLDAHIKQGNGLIGATPALIRGGIPSGAFKAIEGDDSKVSRRLERNNAGDHGMTAGQRRLARGAVPQAQSLFEMGATQGELFTDAEIISQSNAALATALGKVAAMPDGDLAQVHAQGAAYRRWQRSTDYLDRRLIADAWCAAFVWIKRDEAPPAIVNRVLRALIEQGPSSLHPETATEIERLRKEYSFFHWHLEYPGIFRVDEDSRTMDKATGWSGGFSCVLANPPWDKVDFEDKKYFSVVEPSIALMTGQTRRDRIAEWVREQPEAGERYNAARRKVKATFLFASKSGVTPKAAEGLTADGVNSLAVDQLFAERFATIGAPDGMVGCVIPSAIAFGAGGQFLFAELTRRSAVASLYDFENRRKLFPAVDSRQKFCLLTLAGKALWIPEARYGFFLLDPAELDDPETVFTLTPAEIAAINPNSKTLPIFRRRRDTALTSEIYQRIPVLWDERKTDGNPWGITTKNLFNMTDDSDLFRTREDLEGDGWQLDGNVFVKDGKRMLPLYEAKMVDYYNHRAADVVKSETAVNRQNQPSYLTEKELQDPCRYAVSLSWIAEDGFIPTVRNRKNVEVPGVSKRLEAVEWDRGWGCGWCDVTSATNERTAIPAFIPRTAAGHTFPLMLPRVEAPQAAALIAAQSSLVFDYVSRQKVGGIHMNLFVWKQLPVPTPAMLEPHLDFIVPRVLELVYSAWDMEPLARDLGDEGAPFRWDEERRAPLRAELDAFFFRLYGIDDPADVDYILGTFATETGGLKHNEIAKYGEYRTRRLVLDAHARMGTPTPQGLRYTNRLTPSPGQGPRHRKVSE